MGLYDRDYTQEDFQYRGQNSAPMRFMLPGMTPVVLRLLIINLVVFLLTSIISPLGRFAENWLSVYPEGFNTLHLWRLITYQFLHADFWHIFSNMLCLFFFGPMLERIWGSRKFLIFYLICGAAGGILYSVLASFGWLDAKFLVGASGAVLGVIAAAAILFPATRVYIFWGLFPMPLILLAVMLAAISVITILNPGKYENAGGEAAHLAGMAVGAAYVLSAPARTRLLLKMRAGRWRKQVAQQQKIQLEVDRILEKVYQSGISSLTSREKRILKEATRMEQSRKEL